MYQAKVTNTGGKEESYMGLAKKFKNRFGKHKASMKKKSPENSTTLSSHYWRELEAGRSPNVIYKILEANIPTFNTVTKKCSLCLREKFNIAFSPQLGTLNSRNEIFSHCRHILGCLIEQAPDWNPKGPDLVYPMNRYLIVMYNFWSLYVCLTIGAHVSVSMKLRVTE